MYLLATEINMNLITATIWEGSTALGPVVAAILNQRYKVSGPASYLIIGNPRLSRKVYKALLKAAPSIRSRATLTCVYPNKLLKFLHSDGITKKEFDCGVR